MIITFLLCIFIALGCDVDQNDRITGLNPGCNFAGKCVKISSDISRCLCCAPEEFGVNLCGKNWVCDRSSPSPQCYEFSSRDCSKVKQYLVVNLVFVAENLHQNQEPDIICNKWPGLFGQGVTSMLSHDLGDQVQYLASARGWPGTVKSRGVCDHCTPQVPCALGDEVITSGVTFTQQFDLNLYYDLNCSVDYWIYDNVVPCEANYDYGQSAYFVWKTLMGESSYFIGDMNNLLQMNFEDNHLGKSWNNTKIVGVHTLVTVNTNMDVILTAAPTPSPTQSPTVDPTPSPTSNPTTIPTSAPSALPTQSPTVNPTTIPTSAPSTPPTESPTGSPTSIPTIAPTPNPTRAPTNYPTDIPTRFPTRSPTNYPTDKPTRSPTKPPTYPPSVPFYRYWHPRLLDHFYTTGWMKPEHGWIYEGVEGRIHARRYPGTVPLYRYLWEVHGNMNHFYTTNIHEIGTATRGRIGKHGYKSEGVAGYCYPSRRSGTRALYRYFHGAMDHFYTLTMQVHVQMVMYMKVLPVGFSSYSR